MSSEDYIIYKGGNVFDGRGEAVKKKNINFLSLIAHFQSSYRQAQSKQVKRQIACEIYTIIAQSNANFYNQHGEVKPKSLAIVKIMKSLKDFGKKHCNHT
jgi:hypothetical protein